MVMHINDISFVLVIIFEVGKLFKSINQSGLSEEIPIFVLRVILCQMWFFLLRHPVIRIVVRIQQLQAFN